MDHIGNMEYYSGRYFDWDVTFEPVEYHSLYRIHNPEGYATSATTSNGPIYYYYRRDHLGNNREVWPASYTWGSTTHAAATVQRTQYYPSGLPWASNSGDNPWVQDNKYNGKEFVEMHGLDEYDYHARGMYPAIMRFTTIDPLAELMPTMSPYAYCFNNPVRFIDPTGMISIGADGLTNREWIEQSRPHNGANQGYGKLDFGYYQLTYAGYKASNSWSVTTPDGHTTYHFIDSEPVFNYEWIWYPHEEKMYGMPRGKSSPESNWITYTSIAWNGISESSNQIIKGADKFLAGLQTNIPELDFSKEIGRLSKIGKYVKGVGWVGTTIVGSIEISQGISKDGGVRNIGSNTGRATASVAGGVGGAALGGWLFGAVGTIILPGIGTAIGTTAGSMLFGYLGGISGKQIYDTLNK